MKYLGFLSGLLLATFAFWSCGREEGCIECDGNNGYQYFCEDEFEELKVYFELPDDYTWEEFEKALSEGHQEHGGFCYYWDE